MIRIVSFALLLFFICQGLAAPSPRSLSPGIHPVSRESRSDGHRHFSVHAKAEAARLKALKKLQDLNNKVLNPQLFGGFGFGFESVDGGGNGLSQSSPTNSTSKKVTTVSTRSKITTTSTASTSGMAACTSPSQRVAWTALTTSEQNNYIVAVKCLKTKSSVTGFSGSKNLYDDFTAVHITQDTNIHYVAAFLPWHRYFVLAREKALQNCGYTGRTPYWNWVTAADTKNSYVDTIFSNKTGFGGNGDSTRNYRVSAGPFANYSVNLIAGPTDTISTSVHSLVRNFYSDPDDEVNGYYGLANYHDSATITNLMTYTSFENFRHNIEGPHGSIHDFIGGDMAPVQSPNDPLFFLHHAQIDRLWTLWQLQTNTSSRLIDYSGNAPGTDFWTGANVAKLSDMLVFKNLLPDVNVSTVMNTRGSSLMCYYYFIISIGCLHLL